MLAPLDLQATQHQTERVYSGFPWWIALLVEPNREPKSAKWLIDHTSIRPYLPTFSKVVRRRGPGPQNSRRLCAAISGMLFVPQEMMDIPRRDEVFDYAHVRGFIRSNTGGPKAISKADIELIRLMEAKLNLPPEAKGVMFKLGQDVRFCNTLYDIAWGVGCIIEIASESRIGVEVASLFGRATKVYVPAHEIEAV